MKTLIAAAFVALICFVSPLTAADRVPILIIDGQNNHDWKATSPILQKCLEASGRFEVTVATAPPRGAAADAWEAFQPDFKAYKAVISNYNGELWPERVRKDLETYVEHGGGMVIVHAANNAFPEWEEFNKMIGLGWRGNTFGDRVIVGEDGRQIRVPKGEGPGAGHGQQHEFAVRTRDTEHPVMKGIPAEWMHAKDELYHGQRGPGQSMHILATAWSEESTGGTREHEPMVWWIPYGKGKVFTTLMGHGDYSMKCIGFQTILLRGTEWAATGEVTLPVPRNFPTPDESKSVE